MEKKSNVILKANVIGTRAKGATIINEDKKRISGIVFYGMEPGQFDKRVLDGNHGLVTNKQYEEYLEELPCSLCGKMGGKCGCDKK